MTRFWVRLSVLVGVVVLASLILFLLLIRMFEFGALSRLEQNQPVTDQAAERLSHFLLIGTVCGMSGIAVGIIASRQISRLYGGITSSGPESTLRDHNLCG